MKMVNRYVVRTIRTDDMTLTFLLGYLTGKQWTSALAEKGNDKDLIHALAQEQQDAYGVNVWEE
jgi:hypothetical protein